MEQMAQVNIPSHLYPNLLFSKQFDIQKTQLLKDSQSNSHLTRLRTQLSNKVDLFKKLLLFKEELIKKAKDLKTRSIQLQTHAKTLSESHKKQYPVFIVRPSFIAQKFITKQIKSLVLDLGKKFNKLNEFQKMELISYLAKHEQNNQMVKSCLDLYRQRHKKMIQCKKAINQQTLETSQKRLEIQALQNHSIQLTRQKEYLINAKRKEKLTYDNLNTEIKDAEQNGKVNFDVLAACKKKYLQEFNVAVCRERIHVQYSNQLKEIKLAGILNESICDVEAAQKKRGELRTFLRDNSVGNVLGKVASYKKQKNQRVFMSLQKTKSKSTHKRCTSKKTQQTASTAMKTRGSVALENR